MTIGAGGDGIMGAAQKGAGREYSFGLNIRLPFEQKANETIHGDPKLINFNYFFTRKLNFVKETHAVALFPGGFGTMDEGFEVLTLMQTGKAQIIPVVFVDRPGGTYWKTWLRFLEDHLLRRGLISEDDFSLFKMCNSVDEAIAEIAQFYKNYHSYRWVGQKMVVRVLCCLTDKAIDVINAAFDDVPKQSSRARHRPPRGAKRTGTRRDAPPQVHAEAQELRPLPQIDRRHQRGGDGGIGLLFTVPKPTPADGFSDPD